MIETVCGLLVLCSAQGYWIGGQPATIDLRWPVAADVPPAVVRWRLTCGGASLSDGEIELPPRGTATLTLTPPEVRVRTELQWGYRVVRRADGALLSVGQQTLHVFPNNLLADAASRLTQRRLLVVGEDRALSAVLERAGLAYTPLGSASTDLTAIDSAPRDTIVLVAAATLTDRPFAQAGLLHLADAGATVVIFEQRELRYVAGYPVLRRTSALAPAWRAAHPLLTGLSRADFQRWFTSREGDYWALELPPDAPVLEVVWWPPPSPLAAAAALDVLLATTQHGAGRLILCQLPIEDWNTDPRAQLLLRNMLDHALTRPQPTPPPSARREPLATSRPRDATILIPPGVR